MSKKKSFLIIIFALLAVACAAGVGVYLYAMAPYSDDSARVNIERGADREEVHKVFKEALGDEYGDKVFNLWSLQKGTPEKSHGSYQVLRGESALKAARRIAQGRQDPVKLTLNNIRTRARLAEVVGSVLEFSDDEFLAVADSILLDGSCGTELLTAKILPDTYEFYWTATPKDVVAKLMKTRSDFWTEARRQQASRLGLTPDQVHTLASIVYSESKKSDEWGDIARLYINRLQKDMPLQADPTVVYGIGDFSIRRVESRHLKSDSPYNTYIYRGLPPGPIYMVERAVIDSVLTAPERPWLYMCARSDFSGYHDFATTYNEHRLNAVRYHRALTAAGL